MNRGPKPSESARAHARQNLTRFGIPTLLCLAVLCASGQTSAATFEKSGSMGIYLSLAPDEGLHMTVEQSSLSLLLAQDMFGICVFGGLASPKWGPGTNGSLSLSGVADPMPVVGYRWTRGRSEYVRYIGFMERDTNRTLIAHRLNVQVTPGLKMDPVVKTQF